MRWLVLVALLVGCAPERLAPRESGRVVLRDGGRTLLVHQSHFYVADSIVVYMGGSDRGWLPYSFPEGRPVSGPLWIVPDSVMQEMMWSDGCSSPETRTEGR